MTTLPLPVCLLFALATVGAQEPAATPALVVHEWGTFTCLMDEAGRTIGGVNTEDEPLPGFVHRPLAEHRFNAGLLGPGDLAPCFFQGAPACHPDVTMRLETPVLYFHLPAGSQPMTIDVEVAWRGGWLSEFYPAGDAVLPGMLEGPLGHLDPTANGTLAWRDVVVGGELAAPFAATDAHVWLAPREVHAADLQVGDESERFLFYRGVGDVPCPLRVVRDTEEPTLRFVVGAEAMKGRSATSTGPCWLVEVDAERGCAFRELAPLRLDPERPDECVGQTRAEFASADFRVDNVDRLRASMQRELERDGLFADEARALLETWRLSYFRSPGSRVFFLLPRDWTDDVMPLRLSAEASIERVMVGRIELVSPGQRAALARIARGPASDNSWWHKFSIDLAQSDSARFARVWGELSSRPGALLEVEGLELPNDYRAWLELGRFRHALILEELRRRPTEGLATFVGNYGLGS